MQIDSTNHKLNFVNGGTTTAIFDNTFIELNRHITASGNISANSHISASGNISSSGEIIGIINGGSFN